MTDELSVKIINCECAKEYDNRYMFVRLSIEWDREIADRWAVYDIVDNKMFYITYQYGEEEYIPKGNFILTDEKNCTYSISTKVPIGETMLLYMFAEEYNKGNIDIERLLVDCFI